MPDTAHPNALPSGDWNTAFAALPLEAPAADSWTRLSRSLDARETRRLVVRRRNRWLALAAALALVALAPVMLMRERNTPSGTPEAAPSIARVPTGAASHEAAATAATAPASNTPADVGVASTPSTDAIAIATQRTDRPQTADARTASRAPDRKRTLASARKKETSSPVEASNAAETAMQKDEARAASITIAAAGNGSGKPSEPVSDSNDTLMQLQAESARLEALIAMTRDDRVGSAAATVMAAELDQRIGLIDAGLTQGAAALSPEQREALWRERVQSLRELAGVETTQLWLAAQGESYDGALVSVD